MAKKASSKKTGVAKAAVEKGRLKRKLVAAKSKKASTKSNPTKRRIAPRESDASSLVLDRLWTVVMERRDADPSISHSARLLSRGMTKVAQKFGEEAVECLIEAVAGNRDALIAESADVLYHLLVLWVSAEVEPSEVWTELERREGVSGIAEKAARRALLPGPVTSKIP